MIAFQPGADHRGYRRNCTRCPHQDRSRTASALLL
jgi:hypothetical protein